MQKSILQFTFYLLFSGVSFAQLPEKFPVIDKNDLPGAKFQPARIFNGTALFGYIDGGAELYLEYGFSSVWVSEISLMGARYKTEIYKMNGQEEAFGIYSVSKYKCRGMPPIALYTCQTLYQLQICSGSYYISIINTTGTRTDSIASLKIGEAIIRKISEPSVDLAIYLPDISAETIKSSAILAKGKLGIMNGAPDWEDYFREATGYCAVILKDPHRTILSIRFKSQDDLAKFATLHNFNLENIGSMPSVLPRNETLKKLSDDHLLIVIPN
ncbi:MAG: hypothetical protein EPN88_17185 [Bacteroidetes bacterium]|nr:MAG: hypothetical protein EPN88_17185 [Bacteroidota bacterium]